jgi:O-antigen/teichoic acid export membrane protein
MLKGIRTTTTDKLRSLHKKGVFYLLLAMVSGQFLAFVQKILLGRWLTLEEFGRFSLLIEALVFASSLLTLGFPFAMMQFGLKEKKLAYYFSGVLRILGAITILLLVLFFLLQFKINFYKDQEVNDLLLFFIFLAPLIAVFNYIIAYLSAAKKATHRATAVFLQRFFYFISIVGGCYYFGWSGVLGGYLLFTIGFTLLLIYLYFPALKHNLSDFPYRKIFIFSTWDSIGIFSTGAVTLLLYQITESHLQELGQISQLSIALSFTVIAKIFFASINDIIYPYFIEKTKRFDFVVLLGKVVGFYFGLSLMIIFISYWVIPPFIKITLGGRYYGAISLFKIVILAEIIIGFSLLFEMILLMTGGVRYKAITLITILGCFVVLLPYLLQVYHIFGAAYGFLAFAVMRLTATSLGSFYFIRQHFRFSHVSF